MIQASGLLSGIEASGCRPTNSDKGTRRLLNILQLASCIMRASNHPLTSRAWSREIVNTQNICWKQARVDNVRLIGLQVNDRQLSHPPQQLCICSYVYAEAGSITACQPASKLCFHFLIQPGTRPRQNTSAEGFFPAAAFVCLKPYRSVCLHVNICCQSNRQGFLNLGAVWGL